MLLKINTFFFVTLFTKFQEIIISSYPLLSLDKQKHACVFLSPNNKIVTKKGFACEVKKKRQHAWTLKMRLGVGLLKGLQECII